MMHEAEQASGRSYSHVRVSFNANTIVRVLQTCTFTSALSIAIPVHRINIHIGHIKY
jgi:hypothetical protein